MWSDWIFDAARGFAEEPFDEVLFLRHAGGQDFEGYDFAGRLALGLVDGAHAALPDLCEEPVTLDSAGAVRPVLDERLDLVDLGLRHPAFFDEDVVEHSALCAVVGGRPLDALGLVSTAAVEVALGDRHFDEQGVRWAYHGPSVLRVAGSS